MNFLFPTLPFVNVTLRAFLILFRAHGFLKRGTVDAAAIELSQKLSLFLATKNKIRDILKEGLEKIQGFDELLSDVVNLCCKLYEQNMYLLPKDKHMLLKVRKRLFSLQYIHNGYKIRGFPRTWTTAAGIPQ